MVYITGKFETLGSNFSNEIRISEAAGDPATVKMLFSFYSRDFLKKNKDYD